MPIFDNSKGNASSTRKSPRLQMVGWHPLTRTPQARPLTRVAAIKGLELGPQLATMVKKPPRQPRVHKGVRGAKLVQKRVDEVMRRGPPSSNIGKRSAEEAGVASYQTSHKRLRVAVFRVPLSDGVELWSSKQSRTIVVQNRAATRGGWRSGATAWRMESLVSNCGGSVPISMAMEDLVMSNILAEDPITEDAIMGIDEDTPMSIDQDVERVEEVMEVEQTSAITCPSPSPSTPTHATISPATPSAPQVAYSKQMDLDTQPTTPTPNPPVERLPEPATHVEFKGCQPRHNRRVNAPSDFTVTEAAVGTKSAVNDSTHVSTKTVSTDTSAEPSTTTSSPSTEQKPTDGVTVFSMKKSSPAAGTQPSKQLASQIPPSSMPKPQQVAPKPTMSQAEVVAQAIQKAEPCRPALGKLVNHAPKKVIRHSSLSQECLQSESPALADKLSRLSVMESKQDSGASGAQSAASKNSTESAPLKEEPKVDSKKAPKDEGTDDLLSQTSLPISSEQPIESVSKQVERSATKRASKNQPAQQKKQSALSKVTSDNKIVKNKKKATPPSTTDLISNMGIATLKAKSRRKEEEIRKRDDDLKEAEAKKLAAKPPGTEFDALYAFDFEACLAKGRQERMQASLLKGLNIW